METVSVVGACGAVLTLPYPKEFTSQVKLGDVLKSFPSILEDAKPIKMLLQYESLIIANDDMILLLSSTPLDVLTELLTVSVFDDKRKDKNLYKSANIVIDDVMKGSISAMKDMINMLPKA